MPPNIESAPKALAKMSRNMFGTCSALATRTTMPMRM